MSPEWVTASGTLSLVLVTFFLIFRDQIREWFRHPEWIIDFIPNYPDCNRIPIRHNQPVKTESGTQIQDVSAEGHYIRVRVKNKGKAGAEDVEVFVTEVREIGRADRKPRRMRISTPCNLTWKDQTSMFLSKFPREGVRHIDIGHVVDPVRRYSFPGEDRQGSDPDKTLFCLAFAVRSNTHEYLLPPGEYEIDFRIFTSNAKPSKKFTFTLNHTGRWFEDEEQMYRDGLGLSIN